jgi:hypothetical protein
MFAAVHSGIKSQVWPPSFNQPALFKKKVDQQKSKTEVEAKFLGTFSLINTTPDTLETIKGT